MSKIIPVLSVSVLLMVAAAAVATPGSLVQYTVRPCDVLESEKTPEWAAGTGLFAWDPDGFDSPTSTPATYPAGFGSGSWEVDVDPGEYLGFRISPYALDSSGVVTMGELESISFNTRFVEGNYDYYLKIYTQETGTDDARSWYKSQVKASGQSTYAVDTWVTYSTDTLLFQDHNRPYSGMSFEDITNGDTVRDYSGEQIKWIELIAGTTGSTDFTSALDGITIEMTGARTVEINLEPVPEPATMIAVGLGLGAIGRYTRKRTARA